VNPADSGTTTTTRARVTTAKPYSSTSVCDIGPNNNTASADAPHSFTVYLRGYDRIDSLVAPPEYVCFIRKDRSAGRYIDCSGCLAAGATCPGSGAVQYRGYRTAPTWWLADVASYVLGVAHDA
jgi:hypothetical protein